MGITNSNKQISTDQIDCNGTLKITLALSAAPSSLARGLAPWLPSARGVPAWHDAVCALAGLSPEAAASMRPEVSLALLLLLSALALCLIARTVRRADLL